MNINTRRRLLAGMVSVCAAAVSAPALSQDADYPSRPVKIVVPLAAGGITDIAARMVAVRLADRLGQAVIVENGRDRLE